MGWVFMRVKSAEGRRHPENAKIPEELYEAAKAVIVESFSSCIDCMYGGPDSEAHCIRLQQEAHDAQSQA